jgi:uncharacterized membrane protein YkoI
MDNRRFTSQKQQGWNRRSVLAALIGAPLLAAASSLTAHAQIGARRRRFRELQERVRELVLSGEVRPLREVVAALMAQVEGEILNVDFHEFDDGYYYQFRMLTEAGKIEEFFVHARTTEILTLAEARKRFPDQIAALVDGGEQQNGEAEGPDGELFEALPDRIRGVFGEIEARIGEKIVDYKFGRLGNSRIFRVDVRGEGGGWRRFFVNARTGRIRTAEEARDAIRRRFPRLYDELYR